MIRTREKLEKNEDKILAPYAARCVNTRGRLHDDEEPENRTVFQRDRDRILHTTAFRRLEYKTQVFIIDEGDYYRTRLTHTLEVAQIGRTIARALGANEDLTEAICLAHDLGHPAFGHSGEKALASLMKDHGGFEHNKHSFRIVTEMENRYSNFPGLNLSWEVLEGIVKHETEYDTSDAQNFNPELRGHLEAQIANVSDELAYSAHDLDDGLRSGLITTQMLDGIDLWEMMIENAGWKSCSLDDLTRHRLIRKLIGLEVNELLWETDRKLRENNIKSMQELQALPFNVVGFNERMHTKNRQLKDFLYKNLYRHHRLMRMTMKAENIISDLFNAYIAEEKILPEHVQETESKQSLHRTVCDYIAGMTDRFAIEEHQRLFDPTVLP